MFQIRYVIQYISRLFGAELRFKKNLDQAEINRLMRDLISLYKNWSTTTQKNEKYYEYKSRESTSFEEEEKAQISRLFPNFSQPNDEEGSWLSEMNESCFNFRTYIQDLPSITPHFSDDVCEVDFGEILDQLSTGSDGTKPDCWTHTFLTYKLLVPNWFHLTPILDFALLDTHLLTAENLSKVEKVSIFIKRFSCDLRLGLILLMIP